MRLQYNGHIATGDITLDGNIQDMEIVTLPGGGTYLYATTGAGGGLTAWEIDATGPARLSDQQYFPNAMSGAVDGIATWMDDGATGQIVIGGEAGTDLVCYGIGANGQITTLEQAGTLASGTDRIRAVTGTEAGGTDVIYVADQGTGQVTGYRADANGYVAVGGSARIDIGVSVALDTVEIAGADFLLLADADSQAVTSYRINNNGGLTQTGEAGAAQGIGLATPTAMEVIHAFGESFVLLGSAGSSSLSVMQMSPNGALTTTDHLIDGLATRFAGLTAMGVAQDGDRVFVVAGGADDGLSLFTLLPDGRLLHLDTLAHTDGAGLMNVTEVSATIVGGTLQIYVTSGTDAGISQYSVDISDVDPVLSGSGSVSGGSGDDLLEATGANTTLSGGAGDDILIASEADAVLWGGAGRDHFVLSADQGTYRVRDFVPGEDVLDLSDFAMLRGVGQLGYTATSSGARLAFGDTVIEITSGSGNPLTLVEIFGSDTSFDWADRVMPMPYTLMPSDPDPVPVPTPTLTPTPPSGTMFVGSAGQDNLIGTGFGDVMTGNGGTDTLSGAQGHDEIWGGDGGDLLRGNAGSDTIGGGNGSDMLIGGDGSDMLGGGAGHDEIFGGTGTDTLLGGIGDDTLGGGDGQDILSGGAGADRLGGANGNDQIWGGADSDLLQGGLGEDTLGGGDGNDVMTSGDGADLLGGGADHDVIWSGAGNDTASGGDGNDVIGGGDGDDILAGGDGGDELGGGSGNDTLSGGGGRDLLWGGAGNDSIAGGSGNDLLVGGDGDDRLSGGGGNDTLAGGDGADVFIFNTGTGHNRITDFQSEIDHIQIGVPGMNYDGLDMEQTAEGVTIDLPGGNILLAGTRLAMLDSGDFLFL